jgi:uncharacterized ion transporter superfamily protein YfcC
MTANRKLLSPLTILMIVIVLAAVATWAIPAGQYDRLSYTEGGSFTYSGTGGDKQLPLTQSTLDSINIHIPLNSFVSGGIKKPVSVPGTYRKLERHRQGLVEVLQAPAKGIYESIDIILFILVIGGFMQVFNSSGAMEKGVDALSRKMKGREGWLIIILTFLFTLGGSSYGMAEEALVFYPLLIPIFLAAGYDLLVPVAVIFAGTQMGTLSSFSNPFSTIIASNAAGVNWSEGLPERIIFFVVSSAILIWYIARYANKIKKDPSASLVYRLEGKVNSEQGPPVAGLVQVSSFDTRSKILLVLFFATFATMIAGVVFYEWWLMEMTTLFFASSLIVAFIQRVKENEFISLFLKGAEGLLSVAFIVGVARGVTVILNEGKISDSIIFYAANFAGSMPPTLFIVILMLLFMVFTLFISSSSGMAVLTMPIMGSLAVLMNVPGKEIVNAYLFGMGIMGFITPTGLILPSLALANIGIKTWWKFIYPLLLILTVLCATVLISGIYLK